MTIREMFEKVNLAVKLEQRRFFNYYEDSVNELRAIYDDKYIFKRETAYIPPTELTDTSALLPLYEEAVIDNILYKANAGDNTNENNTYKTEFIRKSRSAYLTYWHRGAKGKRLGPARW
ncbi:MAG: hypothetical protein J1G06_09260 [Oscillospiraceae bacterium]|nr:hypothetical protein [Oscillospiraceae bacterium]